MKFSDQLSPERKAWLEEIAKQLTTREAALLIYLSATQEGKTCAHCGKEFVGPAHKIYCSKKCANNAYKKRRYWKEKQQKQQEQVEQQ